MPEFNLDSTEKIISAIAGLIAIGSAFIWFFRYKKPETADLRKQVNVTSNPSQTVTVNVGSSSNAHAATQTSPDPNTTDVSGLKRTSHILFIDDDRGFKIVGILKKMGWEHAKLVTDIASLEQQNLLAADVVFVDIQGVGRAMQYSDEGLGLALAIKRRYPKKKVVIYSAEEKGARFHEALQEADYCLAKTAEPIRFEDTIVRVLAK